MSMLPDLCTLCSAIGSFPSQCVGPVIFYTGLQICDLPQNVLHALSKPFRMNLKSHLDLWSISVCQANALAQLLPPASSKAVQEFNAGLHEAELQVCAAS